MAIAPLSSTVELDYRDSGVPPTRGNDRGYDTLVFVHGSVLNREIFSPLYSIVPPGLRLITYNHRGFQGSTPLSTENQSPESVKRTYIRDLICFLEWLNQNLRLPRAPTIISWAKGGNVLLGLASPTFLPTQWRERGLANATGLILLDCPGNGLGRVPTKDVVESMLAYSPPRDGIHPCLSERCSRSASSDTLESAPQRYVNWICGFYKHTIPSERHFLTQQPHYSDWAYQCSSQLEPELIHRALEPQTWMNSGLWRMSDERDEQVELARVAIGKQRDIPIVMLWNGESPECMIDCARAGREMGGKVIRLSERSNSLMFAHHPKEFLAAIMKVISDMPVKLPPRK